MKSYHLLIKPAGAMCNMACRYCFYHDVAAHRAVSNEWMRQDVMYSLIDRAMDAVDEDGSIQFAFQGGEPTLAGIAYFRSFCAYVKERKGTRKITYCLQTNGILIDEEWISFLKEEDVLVGLSMDGYEALHDAMRVDQQGKATFWKVLRSYERLRKAGIKVNVLCVVHEETTRHAKALYAFFTKLKASYVQLIPCLPDLDGTHRWLTPRQFADFYSAYFFLWLQDWQAGKDVHAGLFDDLLMMCMDRLPVTCGRLGRCAFQCVVEADGMVYPCDFYALPDTACGNIKDHSLPEIVASKHAASFLKPSVLPSLCQACPYLHMCRGGCKRKREAYLCEEEGICGYRLLLERIYPYIYKEARYLKEHETK